jgi:hypothetical protein
MAIELLVDSRDALGNLFRCGEPDWLLEIGVTNLN